MDTVARILDLIVPACSELGFDVFDVELNARQVRIIVERGGTSPDLEDVATLSRRISDVLDAAEGRDAGTGDAGAPVTGAPAGAPLLHLPAGYELEVTTPGLERPLRRFEHFARALGMTVAVRTKPGTPGDRRFEGTVLATSAEGVTFGIVPDPGAGARPARARRPDKEAAHSPTEIPATRVVTFDQIERAHTVFDWRAALAGTLAHEEPATGEGGEGQAPTSPATDNERATTR